VKKKRKQKRGLPRHANGIAVTLDRYSEADAESLADAMLLFAHVDSVVIHDVAHELNSKTDLIPAIREAAKTLLGCARDPEDLREWLE
jgi:hypothetical protein